MQYINVLLQSWCLCACLTAVVLTLQVLSDAAKSLWRRYSAKAKELKQSVHTVSGAMRGGGICICSACACAWLCVLLSVCQDSRPGMMSQHYIS